MIYDIQFTHRASKQYLALPAEIRERMTERIDGLRLDPRPRGSVRMEGFKGAYRIRVGDYRVVYVVDDASYVVSVVRLGHRRDVCRGI
jgi:mRNA interferase RelE/StbE